MGETIDIQWVHQGLFCATHYRCHKGRACGDEDAQDWHVIAIPFGGSFLHRDARGVVLADANHAVLFNKGQPYQTDHPCGGGDHGLALVLPGEVACELSLPWDASACPERPFAMAHGVLGRHTLPIQAALVTAIRAGEPGGLAADELILELAAEAVAGAHRPGGKHSRRAVTRRFHRDQVEAVKELIVTRLGEAMDLQTIARLVGASPYHLSRVFKAHTGMAIHQYRTQLRLREALGRLTLGVDDLTGLALDLGFSSHAHLTSSFSAAVGQPPSSFRAAGGMSTWA